VHVSRRRPLRCRAERETLQRGGQLDDRLAEGADAKLRARQVMQVATGGGPARGIAHAAGTVRSAPERAVG